MSVGQSYTPGQMAGALRAAGFSGADLSIGVAIGMAESGGRSIASKPNSNGSIDYGVWQINSVHRDVLAGGNWADLNDNAKMARKVFLAAGGSWSPWVTFWKGTYKQYLPQGMAGAGNPSTVPSTPNAVPVDNPIGGVVSGLAFIANPHNWLRFAEFIAGGIVLLIALYRLSGIDAGKVASTAIKVAAVTG